MMNFLTAKWQNLIMANYAVDPEVLKAYLPKGVAFDFYEGKTYVSLVGFLFKSTKLFGVPVPFFGTFEEVNLRFYVKRKDGTEWKRGVVFINETVPHKAVAWMANKLYKEHYTAIPTSHSWKITDESKHISYQWKANGQWNTMEVTAEIAAQDMVHGSFEQFIFEHYYGFTRINTEGTEEYRVEHPSWLTHHVRKSSIHCDFGASFGNDFRFLNNSEPVAVMLAAGSPVSVKWKRNRF